MVQQNAWMVLLFNGKVGDVNMYSVILAINSYGESWDSSREKYRVPVQKRVNESHFKKSLKLKVLGPLCNQTVNLTWQKPKLCIGFCQNSVLP